MAPYSSSGAIHVSEKLWDPQLIWKDIIYTLNARLSLCRVFRKDAD